MTMSPGRISGAAFSRSSAVTTPHFFFGIDDDDPGAEERAQRDLVQERCALDDVRGRVDVRAGMHYGGDLLGEHPASGHAVQPLDLDVLEVRPAGTPWPHGCDRS